MGLVQRTLETGAELIVQLRNADAEATLLIGDLHRARRACDAPESEGFSTPAGRLLTSSKTRARYPYDGGITVPRSIWNWNVRRQNNQERWRKTPGASAMGGA